MQTTVGQLMLREALPRELAAGGPRVLDKAGVKQVMEELTAPGARRLSRYHQTAV